MPKPPTPPVHFTPLRYPGGKGKLASFIKQVMETNDLLDGEYAEPYAGGAAVALELLFHEYVTKIHINDISRPVFAFWKSVLEHTDQICKLIRDTPVTIETWDRQKHIFNHSDEFDDVAVGFATFFLNRTNRSGILNAGIIGGRNQTGTWKIDARYNAPALINRIETIGNMRSRIMLSCMDAFDFLKAKRKELPSKSLLYLDPPYYEKGSVLYFDFYEAKDHQKIANLVTKIKKQRWVVSYDNVKPIREMYTSCRSIKYKLGYSAREARQGTEVMFFSHHLNVPRLCGAMQAL